MRQRKPRIPPLHAAKKPLVLIAKKPQQPLHSSVARTDYAARLAALPHDPVFLNEAVRREQFAALLKMTTEELERLDEQGGKPYSLRLVLWILNRRQKQLAAAQQAVNKTASTPVAKKKAKKKPTTPPVLRKGVAPKPKRGTSSPVGPATAGNDWWRESGE